MSSRAPHLTDAHRAAISAVMRRSPRLRRIVFTPELQSAFTAMRAAGAPLTECADRLGVGINTLRAARRDGRIK